MTERQDGESVARHGLALLLTRPAAAMPILLEPVETASNLVNFADYLPAINELLEDFNDCWRDTGDTYDRLDQARQTAQLTPGRGLVSLYNLSTDMFGVDAHEIELPADDLDPQMIDGSARAAYYFACWAWRCSTSARLYRRR